MKFSVVIYLFFILLCKGNPIYAQKIEEQLFNKVCFELYKQNESYLIKEKLDGNVILVEDPVMGIQEVVYKAENNYVKDFKNRDKKEQFEILNAIEIPNLPLSDTVLIIDSSGIFSINLTAKFGNKLFVRTSADLIKKGMTSIAIKALILRGNDFIVHCAYPNNTMVSSYNFTFENGIFNKKRSSYFYTDDTHFKR